MSCARRPGSARAKPDGRHVRGDLGQRPNGGGFLIRGLVEIDSIAASVGGDLAQPRRSPTVLPRCSCPALRCFSDPLDFACTKPPSEPMHHWLRLRAEEALIFRATDGYVVSEPAYGVGKALDLLGCFLAGPQLQF